MSRLIVKNLPAYLTPDRLRNHFTQQGAPSGTITDVKISLKQDGTSRRFGFVGFKTDQEASAARDWFDRTFIDSTRINVTVITGAKDAPAPRPNKRRRLEDTDTDPGPSSRLHVHKADKNGKTSAPAPSTSALDEFMDVMQPRTKKGPSWANEAKESHPALPAGPLETTTTSDEPDNNEAVSDLEWMRRRMNLESDTSPDKVFEQSDDEHEVNQSPIPEEHQDSITKTIMQTSRLFLRNLTFSCTEVEIMELFQPFGEIVQVHMLIDSLSKKSKGLAYVTFKQPTSALSAYEALDKASFQGRLLHIIPAVDQKGKFEVVEGEGKKQTLKDERSSRRKTTAGRDFNWSMLYMNSDAVASSIADRMGIAKADILNPESDNAAVKLALAETHVIQETKSYLESQGVILSSFSSRARSDTTILVKNIPYGTTAEQIREMFESHGELSRIIVPPAGTMAVVEFGQADEAAKAFRAVAYRRLGSSVVYLEKGPMGMFQETTDAPGNSGRTLTTAFKPITIAEQEAGGGADADEPALSAGSTLFVKNLAFSTTPERLIQVFRGLPGFSFARVQTKPDPKRPTVPGAEAPRLSMGYGFVGFKTAEDAKKAMKSMQGFILDGHSLHVKFAGRGTEDEPKDNTVAKSTTTKMIVKNVPFEATKKDIRELFGAHGHLKSVRLPKKFDSRSRGFAFLEFLTRHEAENAYAALRHTHLLGRHLVLQWAEEAEQDIEVLRKKAGVGYGDGAELPGRKRKLDIAGDDTGGDVE
ncbi:RNA-binding domain-containing protein [Suillus hirtellus]|nr:RNA-binding domain-containing protein [Suillus hirtellus]